MVEVFQGGFDDHHLMEVFSCFKVLPFCLVAFVFSSKGGVNFVGTGIDGINPEGVGVHGMYSSGHDHAKPPMLPPLLLEKIAVAFC